jgi:hypothetical protein
VGSRQSSFSVGETAAPYQARPYGASRVGDQLAVEDGGPTAEGVDRSDERGQ